MLINLTRCSTMLLLASGCALVPEKDQLLDPDGDDYLWGEDCRNAEAPINPSASDATQDGIDQNCDGVDGTDGDGDGYASLATGGQDCKDDAASVYPGAEEQCDDIDSDCDETVDDADATDAQTWYADADGDGYGDAAAAQTGCARPSNSVDDAQDCRDADNATYPGATEVCSDGVVNDCNASTAEAMASCGLSGTVSLSEADAMLVGEEEGETSGWEVSGAGDVDGDGLGDLLVGDKTADVDDDDVGIAYLVLGGVRGTLDLSRADSKLVGVGREGQAGHDVSGAGDTDGDGLADVLVGAPNRNNLQGAAYLVMGNVRGTMLLSEADSVLDGEEREDFAGWAVSGAGDTNGDHQEDVLVSAPFESSTDNDAGAVYVVFGGSPQPDDLGEADAKVGGEEAGDSAGYAISGAGDINGDGLADLLIGVPFQDAGGHDAGAAYVVLGGVTGALDLSAADGKLVGEQADGLAGYAVSGAGDTDADGLSDLLIGAPWQDAGAAYLVLGAVSGAQTLYAADATIQWEDAEDEAGWSVSGSGDVDGDGKADFLIGAPMNDAAGIQAGAAYLVLGGVRGTVDLSEAEVKFAGEVMDDYAGWSVSAAGDSDGDGLSDLLVGARHDKDGGSEAGVAYLVLGGGY